jgi:hypothetical protein
MTLDASVSQTLGAGIKCSFKMNACTLVTMSVA